jgi:small subunit ribosomal protein S19
MVRKIKFRGLGEEELKDMPLEEFIKLIPSRQRRSLLREMNPEHRKLLKRIREYKDKPIKTHERDFVIIPEMIGKSFLIHNGKEFIRLDVTIEMLGHYLGEFSLTRRHGSHGSPGIGATRSSMYVPLR